MLTEQNLLGWRVLLQVCCRLSSIKGTGVLLNCLQCILEDSSMNKPDVIKLALQSLLQPTVIPAVVAEKDACIVSFDLLEAACATLTDSPLASISRLMESPETFEQAFHERRFSKGGVEVLLSSEADRRASAGLKALEV